MADSSQGNGVERYESLHTLQSPTSSSSRYGMRAGGAAGGVNGDPKAGSSQDRPQRPGKLAKMVRMASELIVHGRTTSSMSVTTSRKVNYGSTDDIPRQPPTITRGESALVDDIDEEDFYEEAWGQWRLVLLTLGLAGAQLTWTVELGYV